MKLIAIWKVPAVNTLTFIREMREKKLRQDSVATLLNNFAGFNFWYETDESFGDVTEFSAEQISRSNGVAIRHYSINRL